MVKVKKYTLLIENYLSVFTECSGNSIGSFFTSFQLNMLLSIIVIT